MSKNIQSIPLNSELIKALILSKARFAHQLKFMATEVGAFNADVLYIDKKDQLIEVEVKISKSDLINDFKKRKHLYFDSPNQQEFTPHYFYFCTPEFLIDDAQEILKDTKYGLLKCLNWYGNIRASSDKIIIIKKAQLLHDRPTSKNVFNSITSRMASEIINHKLQKILITKPTNTAESVENKGEKCKI